MSALKCTSLSLTLIALSVAAPAQVAPPGNVTGHPDQQAADSASPATGKGSGTTHQESLSTMHERAAKMHALMDQIQRTKDPEERERLLEQHRDLMLKQTQAIEQMETAEGKRCNQSTQDRTDMIAEMLQEMLEHQKAER